MRGLLFALTLFVSIIHNSSCATSDADFYGQSPPVYPSPPGQGRGQWQPAYASAWALVAQMTLEEKVNATRGFHSSANACVGNSGGVPRLGFPGLCLHDGGNGVRAADFVSAFPSGIHAGAAWDRALAYRRGYEMGLEFRKKGINVLLGPNVGPLGRVPLSGRIWEGFSTDPYLSGVLAAESIKGIQDAGVIAVIKHFIGNEQETHRTKYNDTEAVSSNIDDKTLHELYLWPFMDSIHAGSASVMTSYNRVNNSYASQNSKLLNGVLKTELEFDGFVVSDWRGQWAGVASAEAGLDMTMPVGGFWGDNLTQAVRNGSLDESRVTDMATRILAAWYLTNQDDGTFTSPGFGMQNLTQPHAIVDARRPDSEPVLMDGALSGHVLVKNANGALPLRKPRMLSIFGYDAAAPPTKNTDLLFQLGYTSSPEFGDAVLGVQRNYSQFASEGTLVVGGRAGANAPPYISAPYDALSSYARRTRTALNWDFVSHTPDVNPASDACLVFINAMATEGWERAGLRDDFSDGLVLHVAARCPSTIVVLHNAGPRLVDVWIEHPNVSAVVLAHLPGQDSGEALVDLLFWEGADEALARAAWGRLPYSLPRNESDYIVYWPDVAPLGERFPQSDFEEGWYIDYRDLDRRAASPRFEFGFGLTYSSFAYAGLVVERAPLLPSVAIVMAELFEVVAWVYVDIANIGAVPASEVAQLYLGIPKAPVRQLRGFERVFLETGETRRVRFDLTRRDLSVWDVETQGWRLQVGAYQVMVGSSSRDIRVETQMEISEGYRVNG